MNLTKKILVIVMMMLSLSTFLPSKTYATDGGAGYVIVAKEYGIDGIAWYAVNLIINRIAAQTVNWINSGFRGNPAYVTDPKQFFLDAGDRVATNYLSTQLNDLCTPFRANVRLSLVRNYLSSTDEGPTSCSLSILRNNYDQFTNDFSVGGWGGWFEVTQVSGNNPFGAYIEAQSGLDSRLDEIAKKYTDQLNRGKGFLSFERCSPGSAYTQADIDRYERIFGPGSSGYRVGECAEDDRETVTPGSIIETQLNGVLSSGQKKLEAADEIDEIISALLNQLINRALGSAGGLLGSSRPDNNGRTFTTDLLNDRSGAPPDRDETDCQTTPDTVDADGNAVPGVTTCTTNIPPIPADFPPIPVVIVDGGGTIGGGGGQCSATGNTHAGDLSTAMDAVIASNPAVANMPNTELPNGQKPNARAFLILVAEQLRSMGLNATQDVLNGGSRPNTGDAIAVWGSGDTVMERYDAIQGNNNLTVGEAGTTDFTGFIPLTCTTTGGGTNCGCATAGGGGGGTNPTPNPTTPPPPGAPATPTVTSINPTSVAAGQTIMTINGTNLTSTVQFFDLNGARWTEVGTVNAGRTQTTIMVPAGFPVGNATVRIYASATVVSNTLPFTVASSIPPSPTAPEAPPLAPIAQLNLGAGTFPDVTFHNGRIYLAVQQNGQLMLYSWAPDMTGQQVQIIPYSGGQAFPRLTSSGGILWLAFRGSDASGTSAESARLWRSDTQVIENLGGGFGNDPVAVQNGYIVWQAQQNGAWMVVRRALTGGAITTVRAASPTGISRVLSNGSVVLVDEDRTAVPGHTRPWIAGGLTVSEGAVGGAFSFLNNPASPFTSASGAVFSVFGIEESFTPHATYIGNGRYVVATWGISGVRVALIQP